MRVVHVFKTVAVGIDAVVESAVEFVRRYLKRLLVKGTKVT